MTSIFLGENVDVADKMEQLNRDEDVCIIDVFNSDIAWDIGCLIRANARQKHRQPVLISITSANKDQIYFQACSHPGTNLDNCNWIRRKRNTVSRFIRSSLYMGVKLAATNNTIQQAFAATPEEYAIHGGGIPLRVHGVEGIAGILVVSGLKHEDDHQLIVDSMIQFKKLVAEEAVKQG